MSLRRPCRLQVQQLEDRITPAVSTKYLGGLLIIRSDNLSNELRISEVGTSGVFLVQNKLVGAPAFSNVGKFAINNLIIQMGNGNDTVDLRINKAIPGNVFVNLGNGSDYFTTKFGAVSVPPTARIGGNLLVNFGLGNKLGVTAKLSGKAYDQAAEFYNLNIGGNLTVIGTPGSGAELVDISNSRVGGIVHSINIYQTSLGSLTDIGLEPVNVGGVVVNNAQKNTDSRTDTFVGQGNDLFFLNNVTCRGNVTYIGGPGQDTVELPGDPATQTAAIIHGNVWVNLGDGPGTLSLGTGNPFGAANVGGSVYYQGGSGVNRFFMDTEAVVAGDVFLSLGEGNNQIFGNSDATFPVPGGAALFTPFGSATIFGNLTILAGNGNNYLSTFDGLFGTTLSVAGNILIQFGNGNNVGGSALAPGVIDFFNTAVTAGGTVTYRAGTGTNNLTFTGQYNKLSLRFSGGSTALVFNQSPSFNGDLFIDFGTGFGPKSISGTASFAGQTTILNY